MTSASQNGLTASSLNGGVGFNWVFLIELIVCGVLTLFFLFYFNRLFATLVSYGLRAWTWHKYRVFIDIQALQFSLLGGRIFFKGFRYHGNNETILIHSGFITWRYWLRKTRELDLNQEGIQKKRVSSDLDLHTPISGTSTEDGLAGVEKGGRPVATKLPCRLSATVKGLEWFVYNRTPAYDSIIASMSQDDAEKTQDIDARETNDRAGVEGLKRRSRTQELEKLELNSNTSASLDKPFSSSSSAAKEEDVQSKVVSELNTPSGSGNDPATNDSTEDNIFLQFLPMHVDCTKAAVVLGNENTRSILVTKVDKFYGEFDATSCRAPDKYRQLINLEFEHPVVQMKPNYDFKEDQDTTASRVKDGSKFRTNLDDQPTHHHSFIHRQRRKVWHTLQNLVPYFQSSVESFSSSGEGDQADPNLGFNINQWQGLSRYLDDNDQDDKARWSTIEYATVSTILDSPRATMNYYWDIPGAVPACPPEATTSREDKSDINGGTPPGYGIDLTIKGALINYGPWADRQRADLQKVFFPSLCKDITAAAVLKPGQLRVATRFNLYIQLDEETILRVPIREESKNWKWKKPADTMGERMEDQGKRSSKFGRKDKNDRSGAGPEIRPFGWLDFKVAADATVSYNMDMVATPNGFSNELDLDLPQVEITTSVNHGLLWKSVDQKISCKIPSPLQWNSLRTWSFDVTSNGLELFILREHIFLLTDLIDDWGSGPPPPYLTFTPFRYLLNLQFGNFRLYLNCNDSNIINNPADFDDNTFVIIFGTTLVADLCIPLDKYRPYQNDISFDVKAITGGLNLHVPPWNTQATFLELTELAQIHDLIVSGKYQYYPTIASTNTDTLLLDIHGQALQIDLFGFVIRYFMKIKENYFGDHMHFKTLEEYQQSLEVDEISNDDPSHAPHYKASNDLDVILRVEAGDSCFRIPTNLYSAKHNIRIEVPELALDLRFTNYYMDMQLKLCPLAFSLSSEDYGAATPVSTTSGSQLFIDGIDVYGHRVFGLPPQEPTYVCNWDFAIGAVSGECSTEFLYRLAAGGSALSFSFDDHENALPAMKSAALHDITFLRASVEPVRVWLHVDDAAFLVSTGTTQIHFNDWASLLYSKKLNLNIPYIVLACVDAESASRHRSRIDHSVETHAYLKTSISVSMIDRNVESAEYRRLQQLHVRREDSRTHRAAFLLHPKALENVPNNIPEVVESPASYPPRLPVPLYKDKLTDLDAPSISSSKASFQRSQTIRRKASFKSTVSSNVSSKKSIRKPRFSSADSKYQSTTGDVSRSHSRPARRSTARNVNTRKFSASTDRPSSFYSAVGDHGGQRGVSPSNMVFASAYMAPYFPLEQVEPDTKDAPEFEASPSAGGNITDNGQTLGRIDLTKFDDQTFYSSFFIELDQGIRAFCNPSAINAVAQLSTALQAREPDDVMDSLQINCISKLFTLNKKKALTGECTDLRFHIPRVRVRFMSAEIQNPERPTELDRYILALDDLTLITRYEFAPKSLDYSRERRETSALHMRLKSLDISARECLNDLEDTQAAIHGGVEDVMLWIETSDKVTSDLKLKVVELATTSRKVEYLASLLHRTVQLATYFEETFASLSMQQENRYKLFTLLVAKTGSQASDPLFLTRPAYVLRSATDHLRTDDSWKVVIRLRYMFMRLSAWNRDDIALKCVSNSETCPEDARQQVLAGFDQWRSWDLENLAECKVFQNVFGPGETDETPSVGRPVYFGFDIECLTLILDPGPKQNEVILSIVSATVAIDPSFVVESATPKQDRSIVQRTLVQIYCVDASINLNWDLCELASNVLKLTNEGRGKPLKQGVKSPLTLPNRRQGLPHIVHAVVITEKGSVTLDTINIRAVSISEGLKGSITLTEDFMDTTNATVMVAAQAITTKVHSHAQELTLSQFRHPSVYLSYDNEKVFSTTSKNWKIAANAEELSYVVRQNTLVLIEVIDLVVGDEVAQVHHLLLKTPSGAQKESVEYTSTDDTTNTVNVALFLDMYHLSLPLLPSLTYNVSGGVARASLAARVGSELVFDFDIKEHAHDVQTLINDKPRTMSLLRMPPTNGRITHHSGPKDQVVSIFASVEPVSLDAAAIHNLLTAINRPEITSVVSQMRQNLRGIQRHCNEMFGSNKQPEPEVVAVASKPLIYDAHMTFAGIAIYAESHRDSGDHNAARLSFRIGCIQLEAANQSEQSGHILPLPEVRIRLRRIIFELARSTPAGIEQCGNIAFEARFIAFSKTADTGEEVRSYHLMSDALEINLFAETASTIVDVIGHLQNRIKDLDLSREVQYLQKLRKPNPRFSVNEDTPENANDGTDTPDLFVSLYSLELLKIQISWISTVQSTPDHGSEKEDLVLSCKRIGLSTSRGRSARLTIVDLQLQMVPTSHGKRQRSENSALMPEVIFNVASVTTKESRKLAFQAAGKSLDVRLTSHFILPASRIQKSIKGAVEEVKVAMASWRSTPTPAQPLGQKRKPFFGTKRMESLLVDADFAGAIVHLHNKKIDNTVPRSAGIHASKGQQSGRYGQFSQNDPSSNTVMRAPGLACKVEYKDNGVDDPTMNAEVKIDASSNIFYPTVVPLILDISSSVRQIVGNEDQAPLPKDPLLRQQKSGNRDGDSILAADPSAVLGRTSLNLGLRICRQEFTLSCQPIARVSATGRFDDIYVTINTVRSLDHGHFFAITSSITQLQASVQHIYSRESTGSFEVDSIVLSLMNSKHVSGTSGLSAILNVSPMKVLVNAKQLQDFLLFREIWIPPEIRRSSDPPVSATPAMQSQTYLVQRYQQVAATGAFPWNATVSIAALDVQLDFGQAIGKSVFVISEFWISSKKNSDWEQNLCLAFAKMGVDSIGRMSGFVSLEDFKVRTSIDWPEREKAINQTPLVQASLRFSKFKLKALFDYQPFVVADITFLELLMYNARHTDRSKGDRLVATVDGDSVQVVCTTMSASQALALYQAFLRLIQEKRTSYESSLKEIERFMKRKSVVPTAAGVEPSSSASRKGRHVDSPVTLETRVVVALKALNLGAFPATFNDQQVLKLEALNAEAKFAVSMDNGKIHSGLGLTLGQLRIGLARVKRPAVVRISGDITVEEVIESVTGSRGGTILKVPKVEALMETWQVPNSNRIDYIFKSSFEGKVEVGWNYSRISYIRGMYATHARALAQRLGKPLPPSAVKITGVPHSNENGPAGKSGEQQKITAEVVVPQSKYEYFALEPPIIETPQLRDMGEATPPLEWIGLHRDRLPNITHQIVIVTLLELANEVEGAYSKILGSS